jgi:pimeloyl-CoA synthetase
MRTRKMARMRKQEQDEGRRVRVPFGARRSKLQLSEEEAKAIEDDGYVTRWINDADGRIERALAGGYVYVKRDEATSVGSAVITEGNTDIGDKVSKVVSRGEPIIRAYLMKIQKEYYDEDQAAKEAVNMRVDEALAGGDVGGADIENKYVPGGKTSAITYSK